MSEDGQPDEAKEWEDFEGPQESITVEEFIEGMKQFADEKYNDKLALMSCDELEVERDTLIHQTRLVNNERRKRRGIGTEDCHCGEKK